MVVVEVLLGAAPRLCEERVVKVVSGRVRNGRIVLDERVELVEGAIVEVVFPDEETVERVELELDKSLPYERVSA